MSTRLNKHKMCTKGSYIFLNHVHSYMELPLCPISPTSVIANCAGVVSLMRRAMFSEGPANVLPLHRAPRFGERKHAHLANRP